MIERYKTGILFLALVGLSSQIGLDAQVRRGRGGDERPRWAPISLGPRIGYDSGQQAEILGAQIHFPILPSGRLELSAGVDVLFLRVERENQYGVELTYATGGRRGGLYGGGGVAYRATAVGSTPAEPRNTLFGYSVVLGAKSGTLGRFETRFEFRRVFMVDSDLEANTLTVGINFPLWRNPPPGA